MIHFTEDRSQSPATGIKYYIAKNNTLHYANWLIYSVGEKTKLRHNTSGPAF